MDDVIAGVLFSEAILQELRPSHIFAWPNLPDRGYRERLRLETGVDHKWDRQYTAEEFYRCDCGLKCEEHESY